MRSAQQVSRVGVQNRTLARRLDQRRVLRAGLLALHEPRLVSSCPTTGESSGLIGIDLAMIGAGIVVGVLAHVSILIRIELGRSDRNRNSGHEQDYFRFLKLANLRVHLF